MRRERVKKKDGRLQQLEQLSEGYRGMGAA